MTHLNVKDINKCPNENRDNINGVNVKTIKLNEHVVKQESN